jgi:hypothetical protein
MKPLWHAEKGPGRAEKTCAESKTLHTKAEATKDAELVAAAQALVEECAKDGRPAFDAKFVVLHERFHVLAK